jgi:hypothetical protein
LPLCLLKIASALLHTVAGLTVGGAYPCHEAGIRLKLAGTGAFEAGAEAAVSAFAGITSDRPAMRTTAADVMKAMAPAGRRGDTLMLSSGYPMDEPT